MFKTFPEFTKLTFDDREGYEKLVAKYPPVGDISFTILKLWWGTLGDTAVATLNDNLVISYWNPGDEQHSGLCLVGTNQVDQSICDIFDELRARGEKPRLTNVPDFVVNSMRYPELFSFWSDDHDDEYIITSAKYAELDRLPQFMRIRVRKFIREHGQENLEVKKVDLRSFVNRQLLLEASERWPLRGVNNMSKFGRQLLPAVVENSPYLAVACMGLYIGKELEGYCLYDETASDQVTLLSVRLNYTMPRIFDYAAYGFAKYLADHGVKWVNLYSDSSTRTMRVVKLGLRPDNFYRKYIIEPA